MAADEISIFNQALNAVGTRDNVSSIAERSREAEVCRLWYSDSRDQVMRAAYWNSAKGYKRLALLTERDETVAWSSVDPEPGFAFAYALPADCLRPRYLAGYSRFSLGVLAGAPALFCNVEDPILFYTKKDVPVPLWDVGLRLSVAYALASYICKPLTGKVRTVAETEQRANSLIQQAQVEFANDDNDMVDTIPEWIEARGFAGAPTTRYYYPYGPAISLAEQPSVS